VKVYSEAPAAFDERTERLLSGFADAAAVLLAHVVSLDNERRLSDQLQQAVQDRDTMQLAKGIVMQRDGVPEQTALESLVTEAGVRRVSLQELAAAVVETPTRSSE
jgi:AmiR/NasT family two-component response regulator